MSEINFVSNTDWKLVILLFPAFITRTINYKILQQTILLQINQTCQMCGHVQNTQY